MSDPISLSAGAMLLRVVLALGLVLGLLAAVLYLYRRAAGRGAAAERRNRIALVAQRSLGPRTSLAIVEVGGEALLIGITAQQITALRALPASPSAPRGAPAQRPARREEALPVPAAAAESPFEATLRGEVHRVGRHLAALLSEDAGRRSAGGRGDA
jgi:flagellar protein FliO/FliZ